MTEEALFLAALDLPETDERRRFLDDACASDPVLRQRIDLLLAAFAVGKHKLEPAAAHDDRTRSAAGPAATSDHQPGPEAGVLIAGRYQLVEKIGEGGMGEVWVAKQTEPVQRKVALKLIKPGMDSQRVVVRFEAERQALALMDHPNIAKVLDGGLTADRRPYFVMELVNGQPLTKFCDEARLTPKQRLELFVPICQAVQHAHQKGIVHRDLKPANILITLYDGKPVPKVIDFGVAKATGGRLTDESLSTQFGAVVGTFEYMSPEQAGFSALDVDTRADIYSLGVILYELLTGLRPFDAQRLRKAAFDEMVRIIREEEPQRPSTKLSTDASLPSAAAVRGTDPKRLTALMKGELDWIVMKCLEKDRGRRYETTSGLAADVQRYLDGEPVLAHPPSTGYRLRKFARKHRGGLITAAAFTGLLIGAATVSGWLAVHSRRAEAVADDRRRDAEASAQEAAENARLLHGAMVAAQKVTQVVETQLASTTVDQDLKLCEDNSRSDLGLLRLARTLTTIPAHATALRQCVTLNVLGFGQVFAPLLPPVPGDDLVHVPFDLSPDGRLLLSGEAGGPCRLSDALTHRVIAKFPVGEQMDRALFARFGRLASIGGEGRVVRLWDAAGHPVMTSDPLPGIVRFVTVGLDGKRVLVVADPQPPENGVPIGDSLTYTWVELLDGTTGRRVAVLDGQAGQVGHAAFSPDGRWVMTGGLDRTPRVWATADGRLAHTLPAHKAAVTWIGFSPDGTHACTLGDNAHWWPVPGARPQSSAGNPRPDFSGSGYPVAVGFIHPDVVCFGQTLDFGQAVLRTFRRPAATAIVDVAGFTSDGALVLGPDGVVADLNAGGNRLLPPRGRRFHPEATRLNGDRRLLVSGNGGINGPMIDLAVEKPVGPYDDYRPVVADGVSAVTVSGLMPAIDVDLSPELVELWAQVTVRGELGPDGAILRWDEPTWERKRQELADRGKPIGAFPFPGEVARDRSYWLRQEFYRMGDRPEAIPLLERMVATEPTGRRLVRLAELRVKNGQPEAAFRDLIAAERVAEPGPWRSGLKDRSWIWDLAREAIHRPDRSVEAYQFIHRNAPNLRHPSSLESTVTAFWRAWSAYRLGRFPEAIAEASREEAMRAGACAALLASPWSLGAIGEHLPEFELEVVKVMAFHKLGRADVARDRLVRLRRLIPKVLESRETPTGGAGTLSADEQTALREAEALVSGRGLSESK